MRQVVNTLLARFSLSADECDAHHPPEVPVCLNLFASMDHVEARSIGLMTGFFPARGTLPPVGQE